MTENMTPPPMPSADRRKAIVAVAQVAAVAQETMMERANRPDDWIGADHEQTLAWFQSEVAEFEERLTEAATQGADLKATTMHEAVWELGDVLNRGVHALLAVWDRIEKHKEAPSE